MGGQVISNMKKISVEEEVLNYLQNKYGKDVPFHILAANCQSMFSKSRESRAVSERFPNEVITIIKYKKYGKSHIEDNYIEICRRDEISRAYADLIHGIYPNYTVQIHSLIPVVTVLPSDIHMHTPVDEIIHRKELINAMITINVEDDVNKKEEKLIAMMDLIKQELGGLSMYIAYCTNINDRATKYLSGYVSFDDNFDLSKVRWQSFE